MHVRPKKYLGQHFLVDENIARKIADTLSLEGYESVLEIGPGTGMLTKFLLEKEIELWVNEIDQESVSYLRVHYVELKDRIIEKDFLKLDLTEVFNEEPVAIIGNFPYNISSQIVFKVLENRHQVPEFSGMFQKEVAKRICEGPGSKTYGILSVLVQAFYDATYLFTVPPSVFNPPPKVDSGVIQLKHKKADKINCDETLFFKVVKTAFNQRRKTLRNSLKPLGLSDKLKANVIFGKRPEQLEVQQFVDLTRMIQNDKESD